MNELGIIRHPAAWTRTECNDLPVDDRFDAPEFYADGPVVTIARGDLAIVVQRDGHANYTNGESALTDPDQFRAAFGDGVLPGDSEDWWWRDNGWFDLYDAADGTHLDVVTYSLREAIARATDLVERAAVARLAGP